MLAHYHSLSTNQMILQGHHGNIPPWSKLWAKMVPRPSSKSGGLIREKEDQLDLDSKPTTSYLLCDFVWSCMPTGTSKSFLKWGFKTKSIQTKPNPYFHGVIGLLSRWNTNQSCRAYHMDSRNVRLPPPTPSFSDMDKATLGRLAKIRQVLASPERPRENLHLQNFSSIRPV